MAAAGVALPGPGRQADAHDGILITLAVLVFCTGSSMTFGEIAAVRTGTRKQYQDAPLEDVTIVSARRIDAE